MFQGKVPAERRKWLKCLFCFGIGVLFFLAAEISDQANRTVENGVIQRNPCGQGEQIYELYVDGLEEKDEHGNPDNNQPMPIAICVPEQRLSEEEIESRLPEIMEGLCQQILGENRSLQEVRTELSLVKELPEYGVSVVWSSGMPEVLGSDGSIYLEPESEAAREQRDDDGILVYLEATLKNGTSELFLEIPVTVYPPVESVSERFENMIAQLVLQDPEQKNVVLPETFEGRKLKYRTVANSSNEVLLLLGLVCAVCIYLKEREDAVIAQKRRESCLMTEYPNLVYGFLILTGAGYSAKRAWKKLVEDAWKDHRKRAHPLYQEMHVALNQMETGIPEVRAYAEFGRRCGLRSYMKFSALLESSVSTGGKNLRRLLEEEVEEAFQIRADTAKRNGETASSKLLLPMFGMLGVVMVMVIAPAFLSMNM